MIETFFYLIDGVARIVPFLFSDISLRLSTQTKEDLKRVLPPKIFLH